MNQLFFKHFLLYFLPLGTIFSAGIIFIYNSQYQHGLEIVEKNEEGKVQLLRENLNDFYRPLISNVNYLTQQQGVIDLLNGTENDHQALKRDLVNIAQAVGDYDQIRVIDIDGQEVIRVDLTAQHAKPLRNESDRRYFKLIQNLKEGQTFISAIDLNQENGQIKGKRKSVIRVGKKVISKNGDELGIVVTNYLMNSYLDGLMAMSSTDGVMLMTASGYWLAAPKKYPRFTHLLADTSNQRFSSFFPEEWKLMKADQNGTVMTDNGLFVYNRIKKDVKGTEKHEEMIFSTYIPRDQLRSEIGINPIWLAIALIATLFLIAWLSVVLSKNDIRHTEQRKQRAAELILANKEVDFQTEEKKKRVAELIIADKEVDLQTELKEKRAAELILANKEVDFQTEQKEKRAAELIIANEVILRNKEKEKHAAELAIVNEELESFSYSVSHDLRAPLRAVNGFAEILEEDYSDKLDDEGRETIRVIKDNARHMGRLIDDLLQFSRLGRQKINKVEVNMNRLAEVALKNLEASFDMKDYTVDLKNLPAVKGDADLLLQVLVNLFSNSFKYSSKNEVPKIEIGAKKTASKTTYYVKDNGVGFKMDYAEKLFGVFQRLHSQGEFEGTGVGLAIVHRIIKRHGGKIWAEGDIDKGATFYFQI
ncbi:MAG: signal transduction histidine kinase [Bacteroidia bacterium]|jgi:signal transduction histidine kinase